MTFWSLDLNAVSISNAIDTKRIAHATIVGAIASPMVTRRRNFSITPVSISFGIQKNSVISDAIKKKIASPNVHLFFCKTKKEGKKTRPPYPFIS